MTEEFDPFAPQEAGAKTKFGKLKLFANPVVLETGASYTVPGIHDRDGNTYEFRGKKIVKGSKRFHLVLQVLARDKDGNEYEMHRDCLNNDKVYKEIVHPALIKTFGETAKFPTKDYAFVQVEEAATGETFESKRPDHEGEKVNRTTFRVIKKFANEKAMKAAETEYFARFSVNGSETAAVEESVGPTFSPTRIDVFKKNAKKGVSIEDIVDTLVDDSTIEKYGKEACIEAVKAAVA
jgi:hypothetical protein